MTASGEHAAPSLCEARGCPERPLTAFRDGAGEPWWLCERHGDLLAVGFPTRRPRSTPLPYEAVRLALEPSLGPCHVTDCGEPAIGGEIGEGGDLLLCADHLSHSGSSVPGDDQ